MKGVRRTAWYASTMSGGGPVRRTGRRSARSFRRTVPASPAWSQKVVSTIQPGDTAFTLIGASSSASAYVSDSSAPFTAATTEPPGGGTVGGDTRREGQ